MHTNMKTGLIVGFVKAQPNLQLALNPRLENEQEFK